MSQGGLHVGKLLACQTKCHEKRCETDCKSRYDAANAKLTTCPPCLMTSTFGDTMLSQGDNNNGQVYCAT